MRICVQNSQLNLRRSFCWWLVGGCGGNTMQCAGEDREPPRCPFHATLTHRICASIRTERKWAKQKEFKQRITKRKYIYVIMYHTCIHVSCSALRRRWSIELGSRVGTNSSLNLVRVGSQLHKCQWSCQVCHGPCGPWVDEIDLGAPTWNFLSRIFYWNFRIPRATANLIIWGNFC